MPETASKEFENLLELIKRGRGFDFTGYKRTTLMRRIHKRMSEVGIDSFTEYADHLESQPREFGELFNTILINVTSFFREPESWQSLNDNVISRLAAADAPLRVWTAGCASGEETYTLMMLLTEALGEDRVKKHVKIYATDADEHALAAARVASYGIKQLDAVPAPLREKYFEYGTSGASFRADLRRCVIFGRHDLVSDAPISRLDLLVCRNTLIYFNSETQSRVLARFNFSLNPEGVLFLGKSEMLLTHSRLFQPIDMSARIFRKVAAMQLRDRLLMARTARPGLPGYDRDLFVNQRQEARETGFDTATVSHIIIDATGHLLLANQQARLMFRLTAEDVGRPFHELEISYRPAELRSRIEEAYSFGIATMNDVVHQRPDGKKVVLDVQVETLLDESSVMLGVSITFVDVTTTTKLREELERSSNELQAAYEEMQATNEELETTNEELQSSIEEMETTNEELQSTNEELETMNEELQSTNEELETINEELRRRTHELNSLNDFMELIMSSMSAAVVVADEDLHVQVWNHRAEDLWGLRSDEVTGKVLTNLDFGLNVAAFSQKLRACVEGREEFESMLVDAVNRRGRNIRVRVSCNRLAPKNGGKEGRGLLMFMEQWDD